MNNPIQKKSVAEKCIIQKKIDVLRELTTLKIYSWNGGNYKIKIK